jgi:sodium/potassium-transporting ATPase subunit alpha
MLDCSLQSGLLSNQAKSLLDSNGPNVIPPPKDYPIYVKYFLCYIRGFNGPLLIASLFAYLSWQPFCPTCTYNFALAIVLDAIAFLSANATFIQEVYSAQVIANFNAVIPPNCIVVRNGGTMEVPPTELVVGDIVHLQVGSRVPADVRVVQCSNLRLDKSLLTGESEPFRINAAPCKAGSLTFLEATNIAFMGSNVVEGEGIGVVIATGIQTQLAKISSKVSNTNALVSTMQVDLNRFVFVISSIAVFWTVLCVLVWGVYVKVDHPGFMANYVLIANAIGVLVALVPQGLPLAMNVGLSSVTNHLYHNHGLMLKQASVIETFGAITFLMSDKTGTLTQNKMTVNDILLQNQDNTAVVDSLLIMLVKAAVLCNQAKVDKTMYNAIVGGNGVDKACLAWALENGQHMKTVNQTFETVLVMPFSSTIKMSAVVISHRINRTKEVIVKGAPEYVMARCEYIVSGAGVKIPFNAAEQRSMMAQIEAQSSRGNRIIAAAIIDLDRSQYPSSYQFTLEPEPNFPLTGLTFIGCYCVSDPPRPTVPPAVSKLRAAGIRVAMITGDAALTAEAIAKDVGIISDTVVRRYNGEVLASPPAIGSGSENKVVDAGLSATLEMGSFVRTQTETSLVVEGKFLEAIEEEGWNYIFQFHELVFARTTPEQKLVIVKEAQRRGHVVGVTGDGTNDAPALKGAHIGIAMGSGSAVARDAAVSVLLNDEFPSIVAAVEQGRLFFYNLRNVIAYQISAGCWGELLPVLATFFLGMPTPLNSLMMVIVSCTNDSFAGMSLITEPAQRSLMSEKPRDRSKNPLTPVSLVFYSYFFYANLQSIGTFTDYFLYMWNRGPHELPNPLPAELPSGNFTFPAGYTPKQLIGAWNWGLDGGDLGVDMLSAASTGSSVFFTAMIVAQWGHFLSIRKKQPYFFDAVVNTDNSADSLPVRVWKELRESRPRWQIVLAIICGALVCNMFNEIESLHASCSTGSVDAYYWGIAIGFSAAVFTVAEMRKWYIWAYPNSWLAYLTGF